MNDAQIQNTLNALKHPRVTQESIAARIKKADYLLLPGSTVTICNLTLDNGFSVRGESACVDPRNFDESLGRALAYKHAFGKLFELEGYLLAERLYVARLIKEAQREQQGLTEAKAA